MHELKTWPEPFDAMHAGRKMFEFRKHDRDYRVGDQILSRRFDPNTKDYTGECDRFEITFMLVAGQYGVPDGFCVIGVKPSLSPLTNEPVGVTISREDAIDDLRGMIIEAWCAGAKAVHDFHFPDNPDDDFREGAVDYSDSVRDELNARLSASITGEKG